MDREKPRVWIVDDSPLEAELARRALEPRFAVEIFVDGASALEQVSTQTPPDTLVLDWQMPGITGIEVCHFLRSKPETHGIPILMLTVHQQTRDLVEGLAAGADDFLTKPYNAAELSARVAALIRTKSTHDRLQRAERTVRALLRHLPEAVLTFGREGQVTFANREAERMLGKKEQELRGRHVAELLPEVAWNDLVEHRQTDLFALADIHRNGRIFAPAVRVFVASDLHDTALSFRDVTRARQSEESRLDLYSVIAHDLRAPLSTMIMRAQRLLDGKRGPLAPEVASDVGVMKRRMEELIAMVSDFLDLARMEATEVELTRESLDLVALVREVVQDFAPLAESRGVRVTVDQDPEIAREAFVDRRRITQVLSNLMSNAVKFSPLGGAVRVSYGPARGATGEAMAEVKISDQGPGITPAALPQLFTRYARAIDANHTVAGTGLGLMIVRQLVEAHGGAVQVESEVGRGSVFGFTVPLNAARVSLPRARGAGGSGLNPAPSSAPRLVTPLATPVAWATSGQPRRTVLVVDDDDDTRDMVATALGDAGYYVLQAENGRIALELLLRMPTRPDLMLLDIAMPELSGLELLELLEVHGIVPGLPVVVVSAHAAEAKLASRVLRKPVPLDLLMLMVDQYARATPVAPPATPPAKP